MDKYRKLSRIALLSCDENDDKLTVVYNALYNYVINDKPSTDVLEYLLSDKNTFIQTKFFNSRNNVIEFYSKYKDLINTEESYKTPYETILRTIFYNELSGCLSFNFEAVEMFIKYNVNPYRFLNKHSMFNVFASTGIKTDDYKEYVGLCFKECDFIEVTELEKDLKKSKLMGYF